MSLLNIKKNISENIKDMGRRQNQRMAYDKRDVTENQISSRSPHRDRHMDEIFIFSTKITFKCIDDVNDMHHGIA
jgi:hypothetical protein